MTPKKKDFSRATGERSWDLSLFVVSTLPSRLARILRGLVSNVWLASCVLLSHVIRLSYLQYRSLLPCEETNDTQSVKEQCKKNSKKQHGAQSVKSFIADKIDGPSWWISNPIIEISKYRLRYDGMNLVWMSFRLCGNKKFQKMWRVPVFNVVSATSPKDTSEWYLKLEKGSAQVFFETKEGVVRVRDNPRLL